MSATSASPLDQPFAFCVGISLANSVLQVFLTADHKPTVFFRAFFTFPFWLVCSVFAAFAVARIVYNSYLFRLSRSLTHRIRNSPTWSADLPTFRSQSYELPVVVGERDITSPVTPRAGHETRFDS